MNFSPLFDDRQDQIYRIHIIGGPGSGKTTLAQTLAEALNTTAYDLDEIGYEGGSGAKRASAQRQADIAQILSQPHWVTEGAFLWWVEDLIEAADVIIWLDLPWPLALWRIFTRHIRLSWAGTNRHPGLLRLLGFLRWSHRFCVDPEVRVPTSPDDDGATSRATIAHYLGSHAAKLVHCQSRSDVAALVNE